MGPLASSWGGRAASRKMHDYRSAQGNICSGGTHVGVLVLDETKQSERKRGNYYRNIN